MRVLVVHDRGEVRAEIEVLVRDEVGASAQVVTASDGSAAHEVLAKQIFDLMIIDLTLPLIAGKGQADYATVDRLLQELFATERLNTPGDIVGITVDPLAFASIASNVGPHLMSVIIEDVEGKWRQTLRDKIAYARRATRSRLLSINSQFWYDALVVTALDKEALPYETIFETVPAPTYLGARDFGFRDAAGTVRRGALFAIGKSGQASAASITQSLVSYFRPQVALMTGFCGGIEAKKVKIGDLIVFESSIDWDYGKWEERPKDGSLDPSQEAVFVSRPNPIPIVGTPVHLALREIAVHGLAEEQKLLGQFARGRGSLAQIGYHVGPVASGSAVVANSQVISRIRGINEGILGVDMESYGFYHACSRTHVRRPSFACIKAVADHSDGSKGDEYHESCSTISAAAAAELLKSKFGFVS